MNYSLYPKCRTLSEDQIPIIVELYNSGIPIPKIAQHLNLNNYVSIVMFLDFNNIRKKPTRKQFFDDRTRYTKLDSTVVDQMIKDKRSRQEISDMTGFPIHTIKKYIKNSELSLIDYEQKKYREMLLRHKNEIIQLYENSQNMSEIGQLFNCKGSVIADFFKSINYIYKPKSNYIDLRPHLDEIKQAYYDKNLTLVQISESYGCSSVKIGAFLKANGCKLRDKVDLLRERNNSEEFQKKCISSSGKKKKYVLPSGKEIFLRGYEPNFLDYVFKNNLLKEDDVICSPERIDYEFEGKRSYYYPDFYIPKLNLIVETKSKWILNKQGVERNLAKEHATKQNGFNFLLIVNNNFQQFNEFLQTHQKE